jgi:hypothetical protein
MFGGYLALRLCINTALAIKMEFILSESELRVAALNAFEDLTKGIDTLSDAILADTDLIAWAQETNDVIFPIAANASAREKTVSVLKQNQYLEHQDPREILICAGFVGASFDTIEQVRRVNAQKDHFKQTILALKATKAANPNRLQKMGLARLHLKQCYRKIPLLTCAPHKLNWTWANTRSIKKISIIKAQELLLKKGDDLGIQIQLQKLNQLPAHESLAIVQELAPHLRVNIVLMENGIVRRLMMKGPLPVFFPAKPQTPFPTFAPPAKKRGRDQNRSIRSDVKLDPTPFLPAIRVHRYAN